MIGGPFAVLNCIARCVTRRKLRESLQFQKMTDLPIDQIEPSSSFSYCAVDFFGPFLIKDKTSQVTRYGVIFTCMASTSVHSETANFLNMSSFVNTPIRFFNRRGPVRHVWYDGSSNLLENAMSCRNWIKIIFTSICLRIIASGYRSR